MHPRGALRQLPLWVNSKLSLERVTDQKTLIYNPIKASLMGALCKVKWPMKLPLNPPYDIVTRTVCSSSAQLVPGTYYFSCAGCTAAFKDA